MMPLRNWLRILASKLGRRHSPKQRSRTTHVPAPRLMVEWLEDRLSPAVTFTFDGFNLHVTLNAANDTATLTGTGTGNAINLTGSGGVNSDVSGVQNIDITDSAANNGQSVLLTSAGTNAVNVAGAISIAGI